MVEAVGFEPTQLLGGGFTDHGAQPMLSTSIWRSDQRDEPIKQTIIESNYSLSTLMIDVLTIALIAYKSGFLPHMNIGVKRIHVNPGMRAVSTQGTWICTHDLTNLFQNLDPQ